MKTTPPDGTKLGEFQAQALQTLGRRASGALAGSFAAAAEGGEEGGLWSDFGYYSLNKTRALSEQYARSTGQPNAFATGAGADKDAERKKEKEQRQVQEYLALQQLIERNTRDIERLQEEIRHIRESLSLLDELRERTKNGEETADILNANGTFKDQYTQSQLEAFEKETGRNVDMHDIEDQDDFQKYMKENETEVKHVTDQKIKENAESLEKRKELNPDWEVPSDVAIAPDASNFLPKDTSANAPLGTQKPFSKWDLTNEMNAKSQNNPLADNQKSTPDAGPEIPNGGNIPIKPSAT